MFKTKNPILVRSGLKLLVAAAIFSIATFSSSSFHVTLNRSTDEFAAGNIAANVINFLQKFYW